MKSRTIAIVTGLLLATSTAFAQSPEDRAAAQALFDEGQRLMRAKKYEEACKKLEASLGLLPGLGTRGKLAQCYEKVGKTASAWAAFRYVATLAKKQNDMKRYEAAQRFVERLEKELSFVTFAATETVPGMELLRDGVPIAIGALGTPIAVDPGEHRLEARAPGYSSWSQAITVEAKSKSTVDIPKLKKTTESPLTGDSNQLGMRENSGSLLGSGPSGGSSSATGMLLAGTGGALVGTALILAVVGDSKWSGAFDSGDCDAETNLCNSAGKDATDSARTFSTVSVVVGSVGLVAAAAGTYLWLRASGDEKSSQISLTPTVSSYGAGFAIGGRY